MRSRIGECLRQAGLIGDAQLKRAVAEQARTGERLGVVLVRMALATEEQIANALASQLGYPFVDLTETVPDPVAMRLVPRTLALQAICVGVDVRGPVLVVAMADPLLFSLVEDLESRTGHRITQVVATRSAILEAIRSGYPEDADVPDPPVVPIISADANAPLVDAGDRGDEGGAGDAGAAASFDREGDAAGALVDQILSRAIAADASDVHVEPSETGVRVRHRVDGVLRESLIVPKPLHDELVARFKILSGLDVAEKLLPQAGRLRAAADSGGVDFRVSTLRTPFGEKVALRTHVRQKRVPGLDELGMSDATLDALRQCLRSGHGMLLVAGTSGSGRSTTLAASLASIASADANTIAIEDPIEYDMPWAVQAHVDEQIGLTFATVLRASLQQSPDAVLLGDVPDAETATLALLAARSGRRMLCATLADDAVAAVARMAVLGGEASALASALVGAVGQRLVRRLCSHCRGEYVASPDVLRALGLSAAEADTPFYQSVGCDRCDHTGYRGRIGIFEVLRVTEKVRRLITACAPEDEIRDAAIAGGMVTLAEDGLARARSGVTSVEELLRVVADLRETRALCPACGAAIAVDFQACPRCGERLGEGCPYCGRALAAGWSFCPYCARSTEPATRAAKPGALQPGVLQPGGMQPGLIQPGITKPGTTKRGIIRLIRNSDPSDAV
jgi:type IV pilus assembly protein PilB